MTIRSKTFPALISLGLAMALMPLAAYAQGGGNTCVFVFGTINGHSVTTPSVMIVAPPTGVVLGPTRAHVDPVNQQILGFTLTTPGADQTVNGTALFVPGVDQSVPSFSATLNDLNVSNKTCVNFGVTIPAVEIDIPASVLAIPGVVASTPEITINALGVNKTVDGQIINLNCQVIVVPGTHEKTQSVTAGTPSRAIAVDLSDPVSSVVGLAGVLNLSINDGLQDVPFPDFNPVIATPCRAQ